ncbi:hypothetical protein QOT17_010876 [Balamuthia mandrillaris]
MGGGASTEVLIKGHWRTTPPTDQHPEWQVRYDKAEEGYWVQARYADAYRAALHEDCALLDICIPTNNQQS